MKRVAVIGANGQLGSEVVKVFGERKWRVTPLLHRDIEIKSFASISRSLTSLKPSIVINTAAFHDLVMCEKRPEEAFRVNAFGVRNLCQWATKTNAVLVHFSTDYVFGGDLKRKKPYSETDQVAPQSAYAVSKVAGEFFLQLVKRFFLIRTSAFAPRT